MRVNTKSNLSVGTVRHNNRDVQYATAGNPLHPSIVFVPGILLTPQSYSLLIAELAHSGFFVISVPLVRQGGITGNTPHDFATDLWDRIDALYENEVISSPLLALGGHSGGGWLSIAAAHLRPQSVPALVLLNASACEDYELAMKKPHLVAFDLMSEFFSYTKRRTPLISTVANSFNRRREHQQIIKAMEKYPLNDEIGKLRDRGVVHAQVFHSNRDYLVTDVGIGVQAQALQVTRDLMHGHHGACITHARDYAKQIVQNFRADAKLTPHLLGGSTINSLTAEG